ncbi:hypothetical protein EYF80_019533 [Liparis tanakae]|uniref:Uncharacterized protein n=1 Tax=Liparis tanakae TaxID=230148 RepID=A0A4Z2HWW9_9TELE|nr:hypothetical protein EYF80_019533 [Liparis tanakae]
MENKNRWRAPCNPTDGVVLLQRTRLRLPKKRERDEDEGIWGEQRIQEEEDGSAKRDLVGSAAIRQPAAAVWNFNSREIHVEMGYTMLMA